MRALDCTLFAIDFETTGAFDGTKNTPWQLGLATLQNGEVTPTCNQLLQVSSDHRFNPYTPGRWAQKRQELTTAPTLQQLWPSLSATLTQHPLVAHHAATERGILQDFFPMQQFGPWIDTLAIARVAFPGLQD